MAQAYTPGLMVASRTAWTCRRVLPIAGTVLVQVGDQVSAEQVVAETATPGDAVPVNLAKLLGISAAQVPSTLLIRTGQVVSQNELLARSSGMWGWFSSEARSPATGTLETVSSVTGMAILRGPSRKVQIKAYLSGRVTEVLPDLGVVISAEAAVIQGIFGIGGEAYGPIRLACRSPEEDLTAEKLLPEHAGAIVVGGRRMTKAAVDRARSLGVSALISGGIDDQDLREILGYDLGVAVTGLEKLGLSLIITEGFGEIAMARRTFELLSKQAGATAAVNGTTQIRAGVMRPEILIPLTPDRASGVAESAAMSGALEPGASIRVIREPHFGELGVVTELPPQPQVLASESKARVVQVQLAGGERVYVPRANVELIEGVTA